MTISATLLATLIDFAFHRGISSEVLYALIQDRDIDFCAPESRIDSKDYLKVLESILKQANEPDLGLHFGRYLNLSALGIVHQISLQSNSIEQALLILESYLKHQFPILQLNISKNNTHTTIQLQSNVKDPALKKVVLDSSFILIARELHLMLPPKTLTITLPSINLSTYTILSNYNIQEDEFYSFKIESTTLKAAINPQSLQQIELLLPQYLSMLHNNENDKTFSGLTKNMLLRLCNPKLPNMKTVCQQLALSDRSFQRKLQKEGNSFRKISLDIKKELSTFLEAGKQMKVQDIAYILGYAEASAYIHARNNWQKS